MGVSLQLLLMTGLIFLVNIPFGYWRAGTRRFSWPWFLAIHLPVGLTVGIRVLAGIRFIIGAFPLFVLAFFLGQSLGGRLRSLPRRRPRTPPR